MNNEHNHEQESDLPKLSAPAQRALAAAVIPFLDAPMPKDEDK